MTIQELINRCGGNAAFSRRFGVPIKTVEGWKSGKRCPDYVVRAFVALKRLTDNAEKVD